MESNFLFQHLLGLYWRGVNPCLWAEGLWASRSLFPLSWQDPLPCELWVGRSLIPGRTQKELQPWVKGPQRPKKGSAASQLLVCHQDPPSQALGTRGLLDDAICVTGTDNDCSPQSGLQLGSLWEARDAPSKWSPEGMCIVYKGAATVSRTNISTPCEWLRGRAEPSSSLTVCRKCPPQLFPQVPRFLVFFLNISPDIYSLQTADWDC